MKHSCQTWQAASGRLGAQRPVAEASLEPSSTPTWPDNHGCATTAATTTTASPRLPAHLIPAPPFTAPTTLFLAVPCMLPRSPMHFLLFPAICSSLFFSHTSSTMFPSHHLFRFHSIPLLSTSLPVLPTFSAFSSLFLIPLSYPLSFPLSQIPRPFHYPTPLASHSYTVLTVLSALSFLPLPPSPAASCY